MKKLLSLFVLLVAIVTGAQADVTIGITNTTTTTSKEATTETLTGSGTDVTVAKLDLSSSTKALSTYTTGDKAMNDGSSSSVYSTHIYKWNYNTGTTINDAYMNTTYPNEYVGFSFTVAEGKTFSISGIAARLVSSANHVFCIRIEKTDGTVLYTAAAKTIDRKSDNEQTITGLNTDNAAGIQSLAAGTYNVKAYLAFNSTSKYLVFTKLQVTGTVGEAAPAKAYTVTVASNNTDYGTASSVASSLDEGETTKVTAYPKTGYELTSWAVEGTGAELSSTTDNPTTLTMGTANATVTATFSAINYAITHNDAENGTYTISVDGGAATDANATATYGQTITLSGTPAAASFTEISWNVRDESDNEIAVTSNQFTMPASAVTVTPVFSKPVMIKVTVGGGKAATVTGTVGGTADVSLQSDKKFGSGCYLGFTLAGGNTFQTGDIINVNITTASGGEGTTIIIYDADKTTPLYDTGEIGVVGDNKFVLPEEVDGKSTLYICRTSGNAWNAYVDFVEVSRPEAIVTLNANGFATYSSATDFEYSGADAYGMKLSATSLVGTKVTSGKIKAGEGILFKGEAGATVAITETTGAEAIGENNNLIGTTDADNEIISSSYTYKYALSGDTFKTFTGSLAANKAFFGSNTAIGNSLELVFNEAGEATAVDAIAEADEAKTAPVKVIKNGKLYIGNFNVAGQQVK